MPGGDAIHGDLVGDQGECDRLRHADRASLAGAIDQHQLLVAGAKELVERRLHCLPKEIPERNAMLKVIQGTPREPLQRSWTRRVHEAGGHVAATTPAS